MSKPTFSDLWSLIKGLKQPGFVPDGQQLGFGERTLVFYGPCCQLLLASWGASGRRALRTTVTSISSWCHRKQSTLLLRTVVSHLQCLWLPQDQLQGCPGLLCLGGPHGTWRFPGSVCGKHLKANKLAIATWGEGSHLRRARGRLTP